MGSSSHSGHKSNCVLPKELLGLGTRCWGALSPALLEVQTDMCPLPPSQDHLQGCLSWTWGSLRKDGVTLRGTKDKELRPQNAGVQMLFGFEFWAPGCVSAQAWSLGSAPANGKNDFPLS